jgi:hypothetical protein
VHGYDPKPKRRLFDTLKSQGLQANQDVTFLTDGGQEIRALTELVTPVSEHVLDWFHITMRLTVLQQYARGVAHHDAAAGANLLTDLERIKWLLWHGNQYRAGETIDFFLDDVDALEVDYPNFHKFARAASEFGVYIAANTDSLINYGERYRAGERISSCLAESTVNAVISKRFAKRQQMQWTKRGAHLLLQTRTRALDGTLRPLFERWYPGLANDNAPSHVRDDAASPSRDARRHHGSVGRTRSRCIGRSDGSPLAVAASEAPCSEPSSTSSLASVVAIDQPTMRRLYASSTTAR